MTGSSPRRHTPPSRSLLLTLAFSAGAVSLSFEVLWARALALEAGSPLAAFAIVVSAFTAGMAAGAAVLGRLADRLRRPLSCFGWLQIALAAAGCGSALAWGSGGLTRFALEALAVSPGGLLFYGVQTFVSGIGVFLPAFLVGGTLPLILDASRGSGSPGRRCGNIAAWNAAGAAAGALLCGFVLLARTGLTASLLLTAGVALLNGAISLAASRHYRASEGPATATAPQDAGRPTVSALGTMHGLAALLIAGLAVTAMEVAWTRLAYLSFGSSAQAGSLVLASVITGLAIGYAVGARLGRRDPRSLLPMLLAFAGLSALATDPLLGRLPLIAVSLSGALAPSGIGMVPFGVEQAIQFTTMLLLVGTPCLFLGAAFPAGFRVCLDSLGSGLQGRAAGAASAASSMGNLSGAPLAYLVLEADLGARACLLGAAAMLGITALAVAPGRRVRALAGTCLLLATGLATLGRWDPALMSSGPFLYGSFYRTLESDDAKLSLDEILEQRGQVVFSREGPQALVTVRRLPSGRISMQVNGKTDASTGGDMKTQTLTAQLPLLLREAVSERERAPRTVLVVGLGSGVSLASALTHPVDHVDVIELSPEVVQASSWFAAANRNALEDPRVRLFVGDARSYLRFGGPSAPHERYDVIASQPSNPWVAGEASLFTREFFTLARRHLAAGGVMCQWIQGYGLAPEDFRSVVATFAEVYPAVSLWEESTAGGDYLLIGSEEPLVIDPRRLRDAMRQPAVAADLGRVEISGPAGLLSHFVSGGRSMAAFADGARIQTEDRLALEFSALPALHRDTLGAILGAIDPYRLSPAALVPGDPALSAELASRARAAQREREWAAGLGLLRVREPADPDLLAALSYLRSGMKDHALDLLRRLVLRRPSDRTARLLLAHLFMARGRPDEAARHLLEAVRLAPEDARGHLFLSRALFAGGHLEEALASNASALAIEPDLAIAYSDRCGMLLAGGDAPSAEAACRDALTLDPLLAEAHANLGVVRMRRGGTSEAEEAYRDALRLDPDLADARYNLAALLERSGRATEGLAVLQPLVTSTAPADGEALRLAARLAAASGDAPLARAYLDRSLRIEPGNPEAAEILRMLGG